MKKTFTLFALFAVLIVTTTQAQFVKSVGISKTNIDLKDRTVLASLTINPSQSGKVVVRFDGSCISSVGDRIVLAASNTTNWGVNDGNVNMEAANADNNSNSFSHSRVYNVTAGSHTYYAIGHNYVEYNGNGIASIYGNLSVEFFPDNSGTIIKHHKISKTKINIENETVVGELTINPEVHGKVFVHFDGTAIADVGDRVVLAASNTKSWDVNNGNVAIEAVNSDINRQCFSHTRVYHVQPGSRTFYAVAHNYVEEDGNGEASIYGSLTVEFFPYEELSMQFHNINKTKIDVSDKTVVGEVNINAETAGKAVVSFDGICMADVGDRIVLAASDIKSWKVNDGNVGVEAVSADNNSDSFSHTQVYDIPEGKHTFYAIAHNYVEEDGNGKTSIYGNLTVKFFPEKSLGLNNNTLANTIKLYPNPAHSYFNISTENNDSKVVTIKNIQGQHIKTLHVNAKTARVNTQDLASGYYLIEVLSAKGVAVKKLLIQ